MSNEEINIEELESNFSEQERLRREKLVELQKDIELGAQLQPFEWFPDGEYSGRNKLIGAQTGIEGVASRWGGSECRCLHHGCCVVLAKLVVVIGKLSSQTQGKGAVEG